MIFQLCDVLFFSVYFQYKKKEKIHILSTVLFLILASIFVLFIWRDLAVNVDDLFWYLILNSCLSLIEIFYFRCVCLQVLVLWSYDGQRGTSTILCWMVSKLDYQTHPHRMCRMHRAKRKVTQIQGLKDNIQTYRPKKLKLVS